MQSLRKFLILSFICHIVMILAVVDVHLSGKKMDTSDVYEVSIVAGMPAAQAGGGESASIPEGKKFIYNKRSEHASLDEVKKEKATKETSPQISPPEIKPQAHAESPDMTNAGSLARPQGISGAGTGPGRGPTGGTPSEIAIWKARVRGLVETLWKTPPEIEGMDTSLQTTYLLRVSRTGDLLQKKLLVSSGNVPFDRSILIALGRVSRFPQPPLILIAGEDWVEVTMSFTPPKGAH
jgi:hypothetical protein